MSAKFWTAIFFFTVLILSFWQDNAICQGVWTVDTASGFIGGDGFTAVTIGSKIYIIGFDPTQIFNPVAENWSIPNSALSYIPCGPCTDRGCGFSQGTACLADGMLYVLGGSTADYGGGSPESLHILDPASNTWSEPATFGTFTPRDDLMSAVVNGKIYAIGGYTMNDPSGFPQYYTTVEVLDPATNTWSTPAMNGSLVPGEGRTASVVNGKIYVIGGLAIGNNSFTACPNQVFDPSTNTWSFISSDGFIARWYHAASALNGKIYVMGGSPAAYGISIAIYLDTLQVYNPSTDTWSTPVTTGNPASCSMLASATFNGRIYTFGGCDDGADVIVFTPSPSAVENRSIETNVALLPNPTPGLITIRGATAASVEVTNVLGERVAGTGVRVPGSGDVELDLSRLPAGTYFARIETPGGVVVRKILKE